MTSSSYHEGLLINSLCYLHCKSERVEIHTQSVDRFSHFKSEFPTFHFYSVLYCQSSPISALFTLCFLAIQKEIDNYSINIKYLNKSKNSTCFFEYQMLEENIDKIKSLKKKSDKKYSKVAMMFALLFI